MADTADQLAWEEQQRPRVAALALASALVTIVALIVAGVSSHDRPSALLLDSLRNAEKPGPVGGQPTAHIADFQYANSHAGSVLVTVVLVALGLAGVGFVVSFLGRCARARRPQTPRIVLPAVLVGGVLSGVSFLIIYLSQRSFHTDVLGGARTVDAVRDRPTAEGVGALLQFVGTFMFALSLLLISLNAMRAGLLTRTMGILGMIAGAFVVFQGPTFPTLPLFTAFLVPLFLGRWFGGQPPAWVTGNAEPWPTNAEMREQRGAGGRSRSRGKLAAPDPEPVEERPASAKPHPSSKKKRKRRR